VIVLVGIAFVAGMVTAISPCILPVLPIVFAGSATGGRRRPYAIVAGLVCSFTAFTLAATALLSALGLPQDLLRNIAIAVVLVMGLSLLVPQLGRLLERPFQALGRRRVGDTGSGFLLGVALGLLFTPCAGPIIAAVAFVAATEQFSVTAVLVTLAYAAGAGVVLLALAIAARRGLSSRPFRERAPVVRRALGGLIVAVGIVMALGFDLDLQTKVPSYTRALQGLEESAAAATRIEGLVEGNEPAAEETETLQDFGAAPEFQEIEVWLNSEPLTLEQLRGKVVVIDFWTYSCVNCLRTLPFLDRWYETYRDEGLVIVGVHAPEFAFERVQDNVRDAIADLGVDWPVALDNEFGTWNAWGNRYWPAKYFVDRQGHVRFAHFGEGAYEESEHVIRQLLAEPGLPPPVSGGIEEQTPGGPQTPESYLGYGRLDRLVGDPVQTDELARYELPGFVPEHSLGFGGEWKIELERAVAGDDARLRLHFQGDEVFLVLTPERGPGTVQVTLDGEALEPVQVTEAKLYMLAQAPSVENGAAQLHLLDLAFSPGLAAYAFTFGS
jgi:cytochrome c biogenesis protein CcdA/thiol-disulfide isomerase/thioredoxin